MERSFDSIITIICTFVPLPHTKLKYKKIETIISMSLTFQYFADGSLFSIQFFFVIEFCHFVRLYIASHKTSCAS